ncbi:MAG: hypothetical protein QM655_14510 [Nocardioidaceae bacterium]
MAWVATLKNGKHRARYRDPSGKVRTVEDLDGRPRQFDRKREALRAAQEAENRARRDGWVDPDAGKITFRDYYLQQWYPSRTNAAATLARYQSVFRSQLDPVFGDAELRKITRPMVQDWIAQQHHAGDNPATILKRFRTLSTILGGRKGRSAVRDSLIQVNPCTGCDLPPLDSRTVTIFEPECHALPCSVLSRVVPCVPRTGVEPVLRPSR